ncbi:MAG: DUF3261 domain-containing protein [Proteobacteria bacterium]|nr:DUF3261 domain-containing protein [Pseudomonadota bacterium]
MNAWRLSLRTGVTAMIAVAIMACTTPDPEIASSAVPASAAFLDHVQPADLGRDVDAAQLVSVSRDSAVFTIQVRLSVRREELRFVAQDMIGQRLMSVQWKGAVVNEERSPNLPAFIVPKGLLADLVAICWPEEIVRKALASSGSTLVIRNNERIILAKSGETMRAARSWGPQASWTGRLSYRNVRAGYTVDVQSMEQP